MRLFRQIAELIEGDPRVLAGVCIALGIVVALVVYARLTRVRRMKAQARFIRKR